ncbi:hypothetical protein ATCC90586_005199 [Pythium insidiosum]|nr:hypothetical protein ATCC90586_005199 [Pythium insidiosum]
MTARRTSGVMTPPPSASSSRMTDSSGIAMICAFIERGGLDRKSKLESTGRLLYEIKSDPMVLDSFPVERVLRCLRRLVADADTSTRAAALRVLRYSLCSSHGIHQFVDLMLPVFVVRSLEREQKLLSERVQAIKVVRRVMEIDATQMPRALVASLVAIASHKDDNMRRVCLETLREVALANVEVVAAANGVKVLVDAILEPSSQDLADSLLLTLLMLLNEPATRQFIAPFMDTQILLAPFTDTDVPAGNERRQRWMASRNAIVTMMRSWTGIVVLTSNPQGLQSLIQLLVQPVGEDVQKAVLSTICEVFYKRTPFDKPSGAAAAAAAATTDALLDAAATTIPISVSSAELLPASGQQNLLDNYTVIVLLAMIHCGLLEALITLGAGPDRTLAEPAIELLADVLRMSARLLPDQHCAQLLALPRLVSGASLMTTAASSSVGPSSSVAATALTALAAHHAPLGDAISSLVQRLQREKSIRASEMLVELANAVGASSGNVASSGVSLVSYGGSGVNGVQLASELLRDTNRPSPLLLTRVGGSQSQAQSPSMAAMQQQQQHSRRGSTSPTLVATSAAQLSSRELMIQELKLSLDAQMDDATFKDMLHNRSRVLTDKNWTKWNWDMISELLEGPLTNPQRLSEAMKTKFFKRLSGFFRCDPGNKGYFSQLAWIPDFVPFLRPACQMYTLLLNHPEGLLFLKTDRRGQLLTEISAALELEARPEAAIVESHIGALKARMFSPEYCSRRMLREYFTLLGLMSSSKEGLKMMEQSNLFQRLYVMGTTKGHDFLCRLILANLDYSVDGSSRKLLQSWMQEGSKPLRLFATCLLRALLRSEVADFAKWGIDALVTQLTQEEDVAKAALSVLEEAAETDECLLAMILKRPVRLLQLRDPRAESLLLKFLSLPEGLAFLHDCGQWIPQMLQAWRREKFFSYVHAVEHALFRGLHRDVCGRDRNVGASALRRTCRPTPIPVHVPMKRGGGTSASPRSPWGLDWLYRMPWNMEVKIVGPPGSGPPSNLILETYVDGSLRDEEDTPLDEDDLRRNSIRVKGLVVDARNMPQPVVVNSQQTLQACLFLGTQPVDRRGFTKPPPQSNGGFVLSTALATDQALKGRTRTQSSAGAGGGNASERLSEPNLAANPLDFQGDPSVPLPEAAADEHKDWSVCSPDQRSAQWLSAPECSVCGPGERAVWNFRVEMDSASGSVKRVLLKSVEFTLQLLPRRPRTVPLPPHLYGELAKTSAGCQILHDSGHLPEFVSCLRDAASVPLEQRAALWALGHVAATSRGYDLLHHYAPDAVDLLVKLATHAPLVSLRGTCFFVLGLVSRSSAGRRHLARLGWNPAREPRCAIAVPQNCHALFGWPATPGAVCQVTHPPASPLQPLLRRVPPAWTDVLRHVADLSNHITQKEAHAALNKLRQAKSPLFEEPRLLLYVHALLERYSYRLALRQFVLNAFDRAVLTDDVLDSMAALSADGSEDAGARKTSMLPPPPTTTTATGVTPTLRRRSSPTIPAFTASVQSLNAAIQGPSRLSAAGLRASAAASTLAMPTTAAQPVDRLVLLKRHRKRSTASEKTIVVGAPEAVV